jgi:glycosyltransferase involved in cell wall biosynthesis
VVRRLLRPFVRTARQAGAHARGLIAYSGGLPRRGDILVSYGLAIPSRGQSAVGGIVKLQHLSALYPEEPRRFNVVYLVSSRLPEGALALAAWARRKGARVVLNQNGVAYPAWYGPGWERENAPMTSLLRTADHVFYQSQFCRESADRFAGPAAGANEVLYNCVDTSRFVPSQRTTGRPLTLLLGGSQDQWYRLDAAVRALSTLVGGGLDARLIVTGRLRWTLDHGRAQQEATALVRSLQLESRVEFTGPYTQAEAPAIFQRADILVHTKYNDPCPTVVLEGLATGLPVVYSSSGGVPELVGDEAGIGIPAERSWDVDMAPRPEEVAAAVDRVWREREQYGRAARARAVTRFDVASWLARHQAVFASLVSR